MKNLDQMIWSSLLGAQGPGKLESMFHQAYQFQLFLYFNHPCYAADKELQKGN